MKRGWLFALVLGLMPSPVSAEIRAPRDFFGFEIGSDGELARYSKVLEYFQHLARESDRVQFQELGKTTLGNPYVLAIFSSPENLQRLDRLIEINRRLADPRGLPGAEAQNFIADGRPFYFLYATIHSTEVGNGQAIIKIAHRMATSDERQIEEILDNMVLLMVPSQNPDGQELVIDHWYKTKGTGLSRRYPDLYHHYVGHDDNRDWFMFTQKETLLNVERVQNHFRPQLTHDMHQMGSFGSRIFVPPFIDPYDRNIHPILAEAQAQVGLAMAGALVAEGKEGVGYLQQYDLWTPARQYMVYHGQPRILTEIASVNLADPLISPSGEPLGPQDKRWNFPLPYSKSEWHLSDIVDYGITAAFAGMQHMAKYRTTWLENFYKVHKDWVERDATPYAFVIPARQRDNYETFELLRVLEIGDVEIQQAQRPFSAGGRTFSAGSWVVELAQPYGAFAKTMLEKQVYPDLRFFPGGPPIPPYDVTAHTLGYLMGVEVVPVEEAFAADLQWVEQVRPVRNPVASAGKVWMFGPGSNAGFKAVVALQQQRVPVFRSAETVRIGSRESGAGTWMVPATRESRQVLEQVSFETGLEIFSSDEAPPVSGFSLKPNTRTGLWKAANNMPAGWMMWLFEQYGLNHRIIASTDFEGNLDQLFDVVVLPAGTSKRAIVEGLDSRRHDASWRWAYGVGEEGWNQLREWVLSGGTLVALGSSVETAREMFDLPIQGVLPQRGRRGGRQPGGEEPVPDRVLSQKMREAFQSPANLIDALQEHVVDESSLFFCPGSLLINEFDTNHPLAYGLPERWPIFFRFDQAYRLDPGFGTTPQVAARYPAEGEILASGWLLGEDRLRNLANAMEFKVEKGKVIALASQVAFRTQPRATFKLLFNAIFQGPATALDARELQTAVARAVTDQD